MVPRIVVVLELGTNLLKSLPYPGVVPDPLSVVALSRQSTNASSGLRKRKVSR